MTAVLASYRSFDTLGELMVILTAGIAVMLLLGIHPRSTEQRRENRDLSAHAHAGAR